MTGAEECAGQQRRPGREPAGIRIRAAPVSPARRQLDGASEVVAVVVDAFSNITQSRRLLST